MIFSLHSFQKSLFSCVLLLAVSLGLFAQKDVPIYQREITVSEMFEEISNCTENRYVLKNARIVPDKYTFSDSLVIDIPIRITKCKYTSTQLLTFENIVFKKPFDIHGTEDLGIFFTNCTFLDHHSWRFDHVPNAVYVGCTFNSSFLFFNNTGGLHFMDCVFDYQQNTGRENQLEVFPWNKSQKVLSISNCQFSSANDSAVISISGNIDKVGLFQSSFHSLLGLRELSNQQLIVQLCDFDKPVGFKQTAFNESQTDVKFSQLAGFKIALYPFGTDTVAYLASDDSQLTDTVPENPYLFNSLMSVYSKLFNTYKYRGDRESANACYIEMKDLETRKLKFVFETQPNFNNYLNYHLNRFLKYFADYGTSPTRSLSISIRVILFFSLIYFFFYSKWDRIDRIFLMRRFRGLVSYFRQDRSMEDAYHAEFDLERETFEEFKKEIEDNRIHLPFFIRIMAKPLYNLSLLRHKIIKWLYKKAELRQRKWAILGGLKKWMVGTVAGTAILAYGIWLITIRGLNSIVLSINAFSTLGFGDIPVNGISRYITILEGFLGWFLLSIFSVSLISQILQN